eukprot:CAMPEP_0184696074 /NCGR_PEP_ID=MMETSP0313-20130426/3493_1 /TAXON_ID=2792 /ORGANISM="Porphyridium aerugineum, Strain SAG 1380-2" /LENGTH=203 /DNA_ID=CAMNT_0027154639 /DNA_START=67 /DNA_END=674 /DNA_ORIENTATION=-
MATQLAKHQRSVFAFGVTFDLEKILHMVVNMFLYQHSLHDTYMFEANSKISSCDVFVCEAVEGLEHYGSTAKGGSKSHIAHVEDDQDSAGGSGLLLERIRMVSEFWSAGIRAEYLYAECPSLKDQVDAARQHGARWLVILSKEQIGRTAGSVTTSSNASMPSAGSAAPSPIVTPDSVLKVRIRSWATGAKKTDSEINRDNVIP